MNTQILIDFWPLQQAVFSYLQPFLCPLSFLLLLPSPGLPTSVWVSLLVLYLLVFGPKCFLLILLFVKCVVSLNIQLLISSIKSNLYTPLFAICCFILHLSSSFCDPYNLLSTLYSEVISLLCMFFVNFHVSAPYKITR